jgi:hypothetical protein
MSPMRRELLERFKAEERMQSRLSEEISSRVKKWIHSTQEIWDPLTNRADNEISILSGPDGASMAYGYDEEGKPIIIHHFKTEMVGYDEAKGTLIYQVTKEILVEEFIRHESKKTYLYSRYLDKSLIYLRRLTFEEGNLAEEEMVHHGYYSRVQNFYEGRRLSLARTVNDQGVVLEETIYPKGQPARHYRVRRDGTRFELYQPLPKGVTLKELLDKVRVSLVKLVPETVRRAGIRERIYCVALAYDGEGNGVLPPILGVGLEAEREGWSREHGKKASAYIWNPAEWKNYGTSDLEINDDEFVEACDLTTTALASRASEATAIKTLIAACAELNRIDWPYEIQRTDDFVVYPVDFELGSLKRNLKGCVPAEGMRKVERFLKGGDR